MDREISERVENLENSIKILLSKYRELQVENSELSSRIGDLTETVNSLKQQNAELKEKYQRAKIASAMSGSGDGVKETKLRINRLVREIDSCISIMQG